MPHRRTLPSLLLAGAAALAACGDPTRPRASFDTVEDTLVVLPLNGSPPSAPSGLSLVGGLAPGGGLSGYPVLALIDGGLNFDVAFDVDPAGNAVIYPLAAVAAPVGTLRTVGIQRATTTYEALVRAPGGRYPTDTALTLGPGEVVVIEASSPNYCQAVGSFSQTIYGKLVVDSVRLADRTVHFRVTVDPNCGFRSLGTGRPRD